VPKKELDKNVAAYGRLEAQEKRANDLKHMVIVELASYKDKVNQLYDLYYKPFPEIGNVGADIVDRIYDGRSKKIDDLFKALVEKCEKCGHAKCVCEIDNIPDSDCYFRPKLLDEKSVEVNQELLYQQFVESIKSPPKTPSEQVYKKSATYDIGWIIGFDSSANWETLPINERKKGKQTRRLNPGDVGYQDPYEAFKKQFGREFLK